MMTVDKNKYGVPSRSAGDAVHAIARAGLGAIPVAGAAGSELLTAIVAPPLERRRIKWMEEVGEALRKLETQMGVVLESLQDKEDFIDIAIEATRIAIKTSNEEKRKALRNTILNSALPNSPEESLQKMFLSWIDTLTVWHLKLLELFDDPPGYIQKHKVQLGNISMGSMSQLVETALPELRGKRDIYDLVWKDLYSKALVTTEGLHGMMSGSGVIAKRTTAISRQFMSYVKSPIGEP